MRCVSWQIVSTGRKSEAGYADMRWHLSLPTDLPSCAESYEGNRKGKPSYNTKIPMVFLLLLLPSIIILRLLLATDGIMTALLI